MGFCDHSNELLNSYKADVFFVYRSVLSACHEGFCSMDLLWLLSLFHLVVEEKG